MSKKALPNPDKFFEKYGKVPVFEMLRSDKEISDWLNKLFSKRNTGHLHMSFALMATELSEYTERKVSPGQVRTAYVEWQRKNKT